MRIQQLRLCLILAFFALTAADGFAISLTLPRFSLSLYAELRSGESHEYVYYNDKILSELIWDMKPETAFGAVADINWKRGFRISGDFSAALPIKTGSMQDSDWLNLLYNRETAKTTYSKHDAILEYAYTAEVKTGWNFLLPFRGFSSSEQIAISPLAGFRYTRWKWNGTDGYLQHTDFSDGQYQEWNENQPKVSISGIPISYEQEYWLFEAGLATSIPVASRFTVDLGLTGSLWVNCYGLDYHFKPRSTNNYSSSSAYTMYLDVLTGGYLLEPEVTVKWNALSHMSVFLTGKWTSIWNLRGNTGERGSNGTMTYWTYKAKGEGGGAALGVGAIRLGVEFKAGD